MWLGIGYGLQMANTDMAIATEGKIRDVFAFGYRTPKNDDSNDYDLISFSESGDK